MKTKTETTLSTTQLAARLRLKPKQLRAALRSIGKGADGKRYTFKDVDVAKLRTAIRESKNEK